MPRIPLGELEEALADPRAYKLKLLAASSRPIRPGYFSALKDAISRYHKSHRQDQVARSYLEERLKSFSNQKRSREMLDDLDWYVAECAVRAWPTFLVRRNVVVGMPRRVGDRLSCSGQLGRADLKPAGGYAVWLFRRDDATDWTAELQMPLIQDTVAKLLHVPASDVSVGVYDFAGRRVASHCYSDRNVGTAKQEFDRLLAALGY